MTETVSASWCWPGWNRSDSSPGRRPASAGSWKARRCRSCRPAATGCNCASARADACRPGRTLAVRRAGSFVAQLDQPPDRLLAVLGRLHPSDLEAARAERELRNVAAFDVGRHDPREVRIEVDCTGTVPATAMRPNELAAIGSRATPKLPRCEAGAGPFWTRGTTPLSITCCCQPERLTAGSIGGPRALSRPRMPKRARSGPLLLMSTTPGLGVPAVRRGGGVLLVLPPGEHQHQIVVGRGGDVLRAVALCKGAVRVAGHARSAVREMFRSVCPARKSAPLGRPAPRRPPWAP